MSMESPFKSFNSSAKSPSLMANMQCHSVNHQPSNTPPFPQPPAAPPQPPLLPLPAHLHAPPPQHAAWRASRPVQRAKKPRHVTAAAAPSPKKTASAAIPVVAPSKKRAAAAASEQEAVGWTTTDSLYSVSPPPSCVPMPTSLLVSAAAGRKAPTACAVQVAGAGGVGGGVDVGATDELRRHLRL